MTETTIYHRYSTGLQKVPTPPSSSIVIIGRMVTELALRFPTLNASESFSCPLARVLMELGIAVYVVSTDRQVTTL